MSSATDWISAVGTGVGDCAAAAALYDAIRAYLRERARPIILAEYTQDLGTFGSQAERIKLQNVGTSAAFDVTIMPLRIPGSKSTLLKTKTIPFIRAGEHTESRHIFESDLSLGVAPLQRFAVHLFNHFNRPERSVDRPDSIELIVTFKSIEGEKFQVRHRLVVDRGRPNQIRIELGQSLLDRDAAAGWS
jgi:hypothetical protein